MKTKCLIGLLLLFFQYVEAQEPKIHVVQNIDFGKFYVIDGNAAVIEIFEDGTWQASSNVVFLEVIPQPAIFRIETNGENELKLEVIKSCQIHEDQQQARLEQTGFERKKIRLSRKAPKLLTVGAKLVLGGGWNSGSKRFKGEVNIHLFQMND